MDRRAFGTTLLMGGLGLAAAPALGLGFALRLVRNLARSTGGDLAIDAVAFVRSLPTHARDEVPSGQRR